MEERLFEEDRWIVRKVWSGDKVDESVVAVVGSVGELALVEAGGLGEQALVLNVKALV